MLYRPPSIYVSKATTLQENCSLWSMCIAKSFVHSVQALYYIYTGVQAAYYCNNYNTMFLHLQHFQKSYDKKQKKKVFCNYHYLKKKTIIKKKKIQTRVWISVISNLFEAWAIITGVTLCMKCFSICGFDIVVIKLFSYFSYKFLNHIY